MSDKDTIILEGLTGVTFNLESYPKGWRALQLSPGERPKGARQWINFLWGFDIFFRNLPFLKIILTANILVWIIFAF